MYSRLPKLLPGVAHANLKARSDDVEYKATPYENVNTSKHGLVILAVWDEEPEILKQNCYLDEKNNEGVHGCPYTGELLAMSAWTHNGFFGLRYVEHSKERLQR